MGQVISVGLEMVTFNWVEKEIMQVTLKLTKIEDSYPVNLKE